MKRVFIDLDGVMANIHKEIGFSVGYEVTPDQINQQGFYESLEVMPGAIKAIEKLLSISEIDLWIASKTPSGNSYAASEKFRWVEKYFPKLKGRIFITPDKTLLRGDFLIDDDPRWSDFPGEFLQFDSRNPNSSWEKVYAEIIAKLDNNLEICIEFNWDSGEYYVVNNSAVEISSFSCSSYRVETTYDGDCAHFSTEDNKIKNLKPNERFVIQKTTGFPDKRETFVLEDIHFADGQIIKKLSLQLK